jgi:hypothetical protein
MIALTVGPMPTSLYLSFTDYGLFTAPKWMGLANYRYMLEDDRFLASIGVTLKFVLIGVTLKLAAALAVPLLLNRAHRGVGLYRAPPSTPPPCSARASVSRRSGVPCSPPTDSPTAPSARSVSTWAASRTTPTRTGPDATPATLLAVLRRALRSGPAVCLVPTGVLVLRCAAGWREGTAWRTVLVSAFRSVPGQPLVPVLPAGSAFASAALVAMSPVLLLVALGPLALAATAVDARWPLPPSSPELSSN